MRLWLVRHARPLVAPGLCYGASDVPADAAATAIAARELAAVLPQGLAVRSSPLKRCTALAEALGALRPDLVFGTDPRLAEMNFGRWEGRRWEDIPKPEFASWMADFAGFPVSGGESVSTFMARVDAAFAEVLAWPADTVWITHAGVARAVLLLRSGIRPRSAADWPQEGLGFGESRLFA